MSQMISKKKSKNKKAPNGMKSAQQTPISAVSYGGPIRFPNESNQQDLYTTLLASDGLLSSDAGGLMEQVYSSRPDVPGGGLGACAGWSSIAAVFDEYRTLGFEVEYVPFDRYNRGVSVFTVPLIGVIDYDNSGALTSYSTADNYSSARFLSLDLPWKVIIRMSGIENSSFINTGSTSPLFWIKLFGNNMTVSTNYGKVFVRFRVQFRGRGV